MQHWLMKTEPSGFSIDDLAAAPDQTTPWDGVRNYQARNFMRSMEVGDQVLFYHSVQKPSVVGLARVSKLAYPDHTQFDPESKYFDPKSSPDDPRWWMVDVTLERVFGRAISLKELKAEPRLAGMLLLKPGNRLSVMPVEPREFDVVLELAEG